MKSYIGYSTDSLMRMKAASGGVGSAIVKYLLDNGKCDYALSFDWDMENLCYQPKLVSNFAQYNICGSIYQEMNLFAFLKDTLSTLEKPGKIVLFCLPCQTKALRNICEKAGFKAIIIGLTCSSQQSKEATLYLLHRIGIRKDEVQILRYRGNGWPSGVQIKTKDGKVHFVRNNGSIWRDIFHSKLFIQPRCFFCGNTLNDYADIALADPWLRDYIKNETIGQTLFSSFTDLGEQYIQECLDANIVEAKEVATDLLYKSQKIYYI